MTHVSQAKINEMSADDTANHQYKKDICLDLDRILNQIIGGGSSYLPFNDGKPVTSGGPSNTPSEQQYTEINPEGSPTLALVNRRAVINNSLGPNEKSSKQNLPAGSNYEKQPLN